MQSIEVLIADDSTLILKVIKKALLENKIPNHHFEEDKIYFAHNGIEAFDMIGKNKNISMLISDINMPFLNGDDLVEVLLDTELHRKIITVFITSNESSIRSSTKKHTIGTITKPFNYVAFSEQLGNLLLQHHEDKKHKTHQCAKQRSHITKALKILCTHQAIEHIELHAKFETFLNLYFHESHSVEEDEMEFVFYTIVEELFKTLNIPATPSSNDLRLALKRASSTQHTYNVALKETILSSVQSCKELLREKKQISYQLIVNELTTSLHEKLFITQKKVMHFKPKRYVHLNPYIELIIEFFEKMDFSIKDDYLCELLAYKHGIEEFSLWINAYCKENQLAHEMPELKKVSKLFQDVHEKYMHASATFSKMQNYLIGEIEMYLFYKAMTSKEISSYFKKHLFDVAPTTSNILLHMEKISPAEYKKLIENDFHTLAVLSHELDFLKFFKENYAEKHPHTKVFCFSKIELLENWLTNNRADKLLIDYALSTTIFHSGIVYLKYFLKKNTKNKMLSPLIKYNRYYIAASTEEVLKERETLHHINAHIIEKPLSNEHVKTILTYS